MPKLERDIWLYRGEDGRIFRAGDDRPPASEGWLDHPTPPAPDPVPAAFKAFDPDGDGKPGGPRRRKPKE